MSRLLLRDLEPGRLYKVAVRAVSQDGYSEFGQLVDVTTVSDSVAPAAPSGLSWTVEGTAFKAVWTKPTLDGDGTALEDFRDYQVTLFSSAAPATKAVYYTNADRFDFPFESNLAAFGTPRASVTIEIRSRDHTGNISAAPVTATATNPAPSNVSGLTGTAIYDGISLKWNGVSDADLLEYRVYHGTTAVGATNLVFRGLATSFIHNLSTYATDAYYRVVAADVFGTESTVGATAGPLKPISPFTVDTVAPGVPAGLTVSLNNAADGRTANAYATWTAVVASDLAGYTLGYKPTAATDWQYVSIDASQTGVLVDGLLPYTNYDFRIRSKDWAANLSAWSSTLSKTAVGNVAPSTPTGLSMTAGKDSVTVKWTENTEVDVANGAGLYMVDIATDAAFTAGLLSYRVGAPQITVSGLAQSQAYYARVKAVDSLGLQSAAWSTAVNATTGAFPLTPLSDGSVPASSPVPVVSAGIGYLYATVTPIANNDAVTYEWHVGTAASFTANASSKVAEIAGTTIVIEKDGAGNPLAYNTTYFVKTIAKDRDGSAAASAASAGTMLAKATSTDISATSRDLGSPITTTSATAPSSPITGDIWNDTTSGFQKQWSGSAWTVLPTASSAYIASRGTDLVTNGTGMLGTNYNFTTMTFDPSDAPAGAGGSFVTLLGVNSTVGNDEFIPYDPSKKYVLSYAARQRGVGQSDARIYDGIAAYDGAKSLIAPVNYMYTPNTLTTLAQPLNPGDTVMYLTSAANWYGSAAKPAGATTTLRTIVWWDYVDPFGKAWPAETYSRNVYAYDKWADGAVDTTANTITLRAAYSGPAKAAGTKLSNGTSGGTYIYGNSNLAVPETWTSITTGTVTGVVTGGQTAQFSTGLPPGTAFIKLIWLPNRSLGSPYLNSSSQHAFASVSFSDTNAANANATAALAAANGKNTVTYSQVAPGSTPNTAGDTWFQLGDGASVSSGQIIAQWTGGGGTAWYSKTLNNTVISTLDAGKITTGWLDVANRILAKSIDASKVLIANSENLISDPSFQSTGAVGWTALNTSGMSIDPTGSRRGAPALKIVNVAGQQATYSVTGEIAVEPGSYYRGTAWVKSDVAIPADGIVIGLRVTNSDGSNAWPMVAKVPASPANTWVQMDQYVQQLPANAYTMAIYVSSQTNFTTGTMWLDTPSVTRANDGKLVVDGTITTNKISTVGLDASVIKTGLIDATRINTSSIIITTSQVTNLDTTLTAKADTTTVNSQLATKTTTFSTSGAAPVTPTAVVAGDLWIHTNAGITKIYRATAAGTASWVLVSDDSALPTTFVQSAAPTSIAVGDVWIDTDDGKMYRSTTANSSAAWTLFNDPATSGNKTFTSGTPTATAAGDIFVDTTNGKIYTANAAGAVYPTNWTLSVDMTAKTTTFTTSVATPTIPTSKVAGDIWIDSYSSKMYRAFAGGVNTIGAAAWVLVNDPALLASNAQTAAQNYTDTNYSATKTLVNSWKNPTDTTKIDGGFIYTHTVDANVLKTSTLSAAVVTIGAGGIIQTNTGGVQITDSGIIIPAGALDANIIKANTSFITTINVGAGGKIQSTGYTDAGTTGFKLDNTGLTIKGAGNTIDASVLKGGTITGTTINVGAGGTLNIDSTAVVKSNNWASLSTGYKLDASGLEINDGKVAVKTLQSGTIDTATLTLSGANGKIVGTGFSLSGTGLSVTSGTISAAALQIQQGNNLVPAEYAGFEYIPSFYTGKTVNDAGLTATVVSTQKRFGSQALELVNANAATAVSYFTTNTATDRNIEVEASTVVIGSMWVYQASGSAKTFSIRFMWDNAATVDTGSTSVPSGVWTRIYGVATVPAGVSKAIVGVVMPASTTADIDGVQVERQLGSLATPSAWTMPGLTSIDGGIIRTGQLQSTATINVNGTLQPAWLINMSGNAQFGNASVRGKLLVGADGDPDAGASSISSGNYMPGVGWKIDSAGNAEFNSGTFRGTVTASTFAGNNVITGSVISGPANGTHAEMTASGFRVYAEDLLDGVPNEVIRMGVANTNDTFAITDSNGESVASIDETGRGNFNSISVGKDVPEWSTDLDGNPKLVSGLEIYGKEFTEYIEGLSRGVVASGYLGSDWVPPVLNTQGEVGIAEVSFVQDGVAGKPRSYKVTFNGISGSAVTARCTVIFRLRYTVDGSSPSVAAGAGSPVADSVLLQIDTPSEAVTVPPMMVQSAWTANPGAVVRVLLSAQRYYGTGSFQIRTYAGLSTQKPIRLFVEDVGLDVPDTWQTNYGGNDFSGGAPAAPVVKKTYTTTWSSTSAATYRGDGVKRTDTSDIVQGYSSYATINGNGKGLWIFPTMTTTLSGATVSKVEVYAYANHWYYNAGGTAMINVHAYTAAPASSPALTAATSSANWPKPGGRWITLPSSFNAGFQNGTYRGFGLGPGKDTTSTYYGRFNGGAGAKVRITYTK